MSVYSWFLSQQVFGKSALSLLGLQNQPSIRQGPGRKGNISPTKTSVIQWYFCIHSHLIHFTFQNYVFCFFPIFLLRAECLTERFLNPFLNFWLALLSLQHHNVTVSAFISYSTQRQSCEIALQVALTRQRQPLCDVHSALCSDSVVMPSSTSDAELRS